ncbi:acyl-CoA N-acyltransferase [Lentinula aciculospora]|uniref:Acyl-CoA N-acyltransferase n=1 Tax=Lentinula aciculospora TaxID=153920 RepID=A0A9W9AEM9_9AGAR|nr:acyl-CoA N-acyltransferase [Lentinula aciculospora]
MRKSTTLQGIFLLVSQILSLSQNVITYRAYTGEEDLPHVMALVQSELSEPYVIYTFRYFLCQWPHLSFLAYSPLSSSPVGVIVCKQSTHRSRSNRGYIAMLSVDKAFRKRGIASALVRSSMDAMKVEGVDEIVLETEYDNHAALSLYESLGFIREKLLYRFYLNGKDAFRLILTIPPPSPSGSDEDDSGISTTSRRFVGEHMHFESAGRLGAQGYRAIRVSPYSDDDDEPSSAR